MKSNLNIKKVLILPNLDKPNSRQCLGAAVAEIKKSGMIPLLESHNSSYPESAGCILGGFEELLARCDMLLPIGGDGTLLQAASHAIASDKPILGINTGRVGFLTQLEISELHELRRLATGEFALENRMLLNANVIAESGEEVHRQVLNDVVFHNKGGSLADMIVRKGDQIIAFQRANGLIFATPTGSTAYSLASGGSIADPSLDVILLTFICPYSAYNRSLILPADGEYIVSGAVESGQVEISFDGSPPKTIPGKDRISVGKAERRIKLVTLGLRDFYSNLYDKLSLRK